MDIGLDGAAASDRGKPGQAEQEKALTAEIRSGLAAAEFEPFFQPIVSLADGKITGFEALARWHSPIRGLVAPIEFVGPAEANGLIQEIDTAILDHAWRTLDKALQSYPLHPVPLLSVNLSAKHFLDSDIVDHVRVIAAARSDDAPRLQVEITETLLINNTERAEQILGQLKALNVSIALDDFGTGYSSLVYLHRFPIDCIKIDRSFSELIVRSDRSRAIVRSIINLAQSMGLRTVAEGVEEEDVADALSALGCQCAQGTRFGHPLPQAGLIELLKRG